MAHDDLPFSGGAPALTHYHREGYAQIVLSLLPLTRPPPPPARRTGLQLAGRPLPQAGVRNVPGTRSGRPRSERSRYLASLGRSGGEPLRLDLATSSWAAP